MTRQFELEKYRDRLRDADLYKYSGKVTQVVGLTVECTGLNARMGEICRIYTGKGADFIFAEVVGFRDKKVLLMPLGVLSGVGAENYVVPTGESLKVPVGMDALGRILDGLGKPMDGKGDFTPDSLYPIENMPPNPLERTRIHEVLPLGIKAIDSLLTVGRGQRVGIFAGSGVGKSTLLGMIARNAKADVNVIVLIGERGREVLDFMEKDLKEEGLKRSVVVVATSDQPALVRLKSASVGTSIAEYFRDRGLNVLLLMDSITRYAMAQREIGMATGEPPVSRGYTPSVYAILPKLLERSGTSSKGSITALYTVLVDGDDMNEPISDTVRGILDGHIVLSRRLANANHYPAIDVLASISRLMPDIVEEEHYASAGHVKNMMATYRDAQDIISIGAYKKGSNPEIDRAIDLHKPIDGLLLQGIGESYTFEETLQMLRSLK
ncbi:MAG: flagellar protein export ATPase FliI [Clostridiaceae bacterium]|nr:flagellar protein export ATPase FliI [Eubacteriales bacterium]